MKWRRPKGPQKPMFRVLGEVAYERLRQDRKWGEQNHPDGTGSDLAVWHSGDAAISDWARTRCEVAAEADAVTFEHILTEEWAEALDAEGPDLREELIQVAAVAVAWIEAIDRRAA